MQRSITPDAKTPWTRIIEHKWFEFGKDENGNDLPKTVISREYSSEWKPGDEPYYPVNDEKNGALYAQYKELADAESKVYSADVLVSTNIMIWMLLWQQHLTVLQIIYNCRWWGDL